MDLKRKEKKPMWCERDRDQSRDRDHTMTWRRRIDASRRDRHVAVTWVLPMAVYNVPRWNVKKRNRFSLWITCERVTKITIGQHRLPTKMAPGSFISTYLRLWREEWNITWSLWANQRAVQPPAQIPCKNVLFFEVKCAKFKIWISSNIFRSAMSIPGSMGMSMPNIKHVSLSV